MNETKQKAKELVEKFLEIKDSQSRDGGNLMFENEAKQCALIVCDEIIDFQNYIYKDWDDAKGTYWQSVKQEITKL